LNKKSALQKKLSTPSSPSLFDLLWSVRKGALQSPENTVSPRKENQQTPLSYGKKKPPEKCSVLCTKNKTKSPRPPKAVKSPPVALLCRAEKKKQRYIPIQSDK
jgi:hypothetical protein